MILGIFGRFMAENKNYSLRDLGGGHPVTPDSFLPRAGPRGPADKFFFRHLKISIKWWIYIRVMLNPVKRLRRGIQKTRLGSPGDPPQSPEG